MVFVHFIYVFVVNKKSSVEIPCFTAWSDGFSLFPQHPCMVRMLTYMKTIQLNEMQLNIPYTSIYRVSHGFRHLEPAFNTNHNIPPTKPHLQKTHPGYRKQKQVAVSMSILHRIFLYRPLLRSNRYLADLTWQIDRLLSISMQMLLHIHLLSNKKHGFAEKSVHWKFPHLKNK